MCGIFALFLKRPLTDGDLTLGRRGTSLLTHRGPDGRGEWHDRDAGVYLGHRRLAIIDPNERSDQPFTRNGRVIIYNGELYNFHELRRELEAAGEVFTTSSDTEVVAAALDHWGQAALERFDGMFAYAHWDGNTARLAVDAFSEKPLYFAALDDGVYISSEIAALAKVLGLRPRISESGLAAYLSLGYFPAPATAYKEIQKLIPASALQIRNGRTHIFKRYWTAPVGTPGKRAPQPLSKNELDRLAEALVGSLEKRLYADVPISLFLSAGVDSALVAALCVRELDKKPQAITISFPDGMGLDEAGPARDIARALGLDHRVTKSHGDRDRTGPDALIDLLGQPTDIISALSIQQMARAAAKTHKVALTGIGGDELSMGYGKYSFAWKWRKILDLPPSLRALASRLILPFKFLSPRARRFPLQFPTVPHERYLAIKNNGAIDLLRLLPGFDDWAKRSFAVAPTLPLFLAMSAYDKNAGLSDQQLYACDIGAMRESVELRTPFLNRDVANVVASFDPRALVAFGQKSMLRTLLGRYLPKTLFDFPKAGLIFPHDIALGNIGDTMPRLSGVPDEFITQIWQRRFESGSLAKIAIRLAMAEVFLARDIDTA